LALAARLARQRGPIFGASVMSTMRILIAEEHTLMRAGIRLLIAAVAGAEVVAETGDGREALRLIGEKRPDVALVSLSMPGLNGLDVAARARAESPTTRVLLVSMHDDDERVRRALLAGAAGYVPKNADRKELETALRTVARGDPWPSPASRPIATTNIEEEWNTDEEPFDVLTPRQREVLQLIAEGLLSKEIAAQLGVSLKTVDTHRTELMRRLGIRGIAGLVRYAVRVGLVRLGP
jgi:DNA-binding NarL/FixJ family response regulator